MFNNIPEMFAYIENLRKTLDKIILSRKEQLNNFCECCHKKEIEVEWRPTNFCNEYFEEGVMKYKIDIKFINNSATNGPATNPARKKIKRTIERLCIFNIFFIIIFFMI